MSPLIEAADLVYLSVAAPATWSRRCATAPSGRPSCGLAGAAPWPGAALARWRWASGRWSGPGAVRGMPAHWEPGLSLLPGIGVIPHYDRFGPERTLPRVQEAPAA